MVKAICFDTLLQILSLKSLFALKLCKMWLLSAEKKELKPQRLLPESKKASEMLAA
jgi:hypothetical protein